jgi:hypothetical protein
MSRSRIYDLLFIILATGILLAFTETGNASIIGRYALVFVIAAYFSGKFVAAKK